MSWLRLDDTFAQHPKVVRLARGDRWTWVEVLLYCARYRTDGRVPEAISEAVRAATPAFLNRCYELHLLDLNGSGEAPTYVVHDWDFYNPKDPTGAVRKQRQRDRERDESRDEGVTSHVTERDEGVTRARTRVGRRARPVPSPGSTTQGEGTGAKLATPSSSPPTPSATTSSSSGEPPGRERFACDYVFSGGVECGLDFATKGELEAHVRTLGHEVDHELNESGGF